MVELVVAMIIAAIVAGFMAMMIATPVDAYMSQSRRADLSDAAEVAMRELSADVANAAPNSLREFTVNGVRVLAMLPISGIATYSTSWTSGDTLDVLSDDSSFDTATWVDVDGPIRHIVIGSGTSAVTDVYQPTTTFGVITPSAIGVVTNPTVDHFQLSANFRFTEAPLSPRAYLVGDVTRYECDLAAGELRRREGIPIDAALGPIAGPATIIARDISACTFQVLDGTAEHGGIAIIAITVSRIVNGNAENVRVLQQVKVENAT